MDPMADDAFEFQYNFIRSGGVQLALNMLTKNNFLPNADLPTRRWVNSVEVKKNWTPEKKGCNCPKIWTMLFYHREVFPNTADGMANSVDNDQRRSSLIWVHTVHLGLSVRKLRIIMESGSLRKALFYRKFPKYSDTQNICCNHSKIWTMWLYHWVMSPNDADGMANSVDPDQTAPWSSLIRVFTVCPGISVRKLRIITVNYCTCTAVGSAEKWYFITLIVLFVYIFFLEQNAVNWCHDVNLYWCQLHGHITG